MMLRLIGQVPENPLHFQWHAGRIAVGIRVLPQLRRRSCRTSSLMTCWRCSGIGCSPSTRMRRCT